MINMNWSFYSKLFVYFMLMDVMRMNKYRYEGIARCFESVNEISSSKFHVKPDGDIVVGKVNATEGSIGGFTV